LGLNLAGIPFEGHRMPTADWLAVKANFPYQREPVTDFL
jgi:hypothetical protein